MRATGAWTRQTVYEVAGLLCLRYLLANFGAYLADRVSHDDYTDLLRSLSVDAAEGEGVLQQELRDQSQYCKFRLLRFRHARTARERDETAKLHTDLRLSRLRVGYSRLRRKRGPTIVYCSLFVSIIFESQLADKAAER